MVLLSANSRLEYDKNFSDTERAVSLVGEARFEVAKDETRPFVVHAGDLQTTVLGTEFNVKTYPQCTSAVQLYKGSVRVDVKDRKSVVMTPGEELSVVEGNEIKMNRTGVEEKGWSRNEFLFDNSDLKSVMQEIGTWYNMDVVFASSDLLDERIYFRISRDLSCVELLQILNDLQIASFREENGRIRVLPSNP